MVLHQLQTILAAMDVENATKEKKLESDLAMDSQEILCLRMDLESAFGIKFTDGEIKRELTVLDVASLISKKRADQLEQGEFQGRLTEDICIEVKADAVYSALFDVATWPGKLPHVKAINLTYDDGFYQEFSMDVDGADGRPISVRSVRRCAPNQISFFQPTPPQFLKHHCGEWFVQPMSDDVTHVTTIHRWNPSGDENHTGAENGERIAELLREHARFALSSWKNILEGAQQ